MKRIISIFLLCMLLVLTGCTGSVKEVEKNSEDKNDKIQIGMSFDSFVIERWQRDRDVFVSKAKELGAEVNVQNANGDIEKQKEQIEYFIKKGVDVIVIICIDSDSLQATVQKAQDNGIKIIAYDRLLTKANVDLYISFDNEKVGALMAEGIINSGNDVENVIMLGGSPLDNNVTLVERGFTNKLRENNIKVLDSIHCDGWRAETAGEYVFNNASKVSRAQAIMCGNDNLAGKVILALAEKRMAGNVIVVGQDADLEACQRIVEGTQLMTVYKPVEKLAKTAAECAIALAEGESLQKFESSLINDGSNYVPYIGLNPIAVTKDNMDEVIINSGFHLKEDVYLYEQNNMEQ